MKVEAEQLPPDMAKPKEAEPSEAVDRHEEHGVGGLKCQADEMGMECFMYVCVFLVKEEWKFTDSYSCGNLAIKYPTWMV